MNRLALLVAATFFMEFLDGTILTTALPKMAQSLGVAPISLSPGVSIYALTIAVFILPGAWMIERFGARAVLTGAIVLFTFSSILCGVASAPWAFIAARALQGIGGAFMVPVGRVVVLRTTPKAGILRATALLTWPGLAAPLIGPPLGGFLTEAVSWRAIFFVNLPLGVVGAVLAWIWTPALEQGPKKRFDALGFALAAIALGAALAALDADIVIGFALGFLAIVAAFAFARHLRRVPDAILDFSPMRYATFRLTLTGGTAARVIISAVPFVLPLMFQLGLGYDAMRAGFSVVPLFLGNLGIKPFTTPILRTFGFRRVLIFNACLQAATMFACAGVGPGVSPILVTALLIVSGASRSMHFTALGTLPFADVDPRDMNMASLIYSAAFQAALGFGVGVGAALVKLGAFVAPPPLGPFRFAFVALGLLMLAAMASHARLARNAGDAVARPAVQPEDGSST